MLTVKVSPKTGLAGWRRRLKRALNAVQDMEPTFDGVFHPFMLAHMRDQFESGGRAGGSPWAGLEGEPRYAAFKRSIVGNAGVLRWPTLNEQLYPSLVSRGSGHIERSSDAAARFGTAVPHAATLDKGGVGPFGERYPARKILALGPNRASQLYALIKQDVEARIDGRRRRPTIRL